MISHHKKMLLFYKETCICFTNKFTSIQKKSILVPNSLPLPFAFRLFSLPFSCVNIVLNFHLYFLALLKSSIYFANYFIPHIIYSYDGLRIIWQVVKELICLITVYNVSVVFRYDDVNGSSLQRLSGVIPHKRAYLLAWVSDERTVVREVAFPTAVTAGLSLVLHDIIGYLLLTSGLKDNRIWWAFYQEL